MFVFVKQMTAYEMRISDWSSYVCSSVLARLVASYMAVGCVHGVLNTDNISITVESFDDGPWRFNPTWNGSFTAAYFDESGLYAFGRQAETLQWNLLQLANCITPIAPVAMLQPVFDS